MEIKCTKCGSILTTEGDVFFGEGTSLDCKNCGCNHMFKAQLWDNEGEMKGKIIIVDGCREDEHGN